MKLIILLTLVLSISSSFAATDKQAEENRGEQRKHVEDEENTRNKRPMKEDGLESLEAESINDKRVGDDTNKRVEVDCQIENRLDSE